MSSPRLSVVPAVAAAPDATGSGQTSKVIAFDRLRARASARVRRVVAVTPHQARLFWADLLERRCGCREEAALVFGVTFQTACNWFDGFSTPTGDKVMMAVALWPGEFGLRAADERVAA